MTKNLLDHTLNELNDNDLSVLHLSNEQASEFLKKIKTTLRSTDYYYISEESGLLPFLSIKDNLLIGLSKKELTDFRQQLLKWGQAFKLTGQLSATDPQKLSPEMVFLIHLVRALSLKRELILINTLSLDDPCLFSQSLIPSLKKAATEKRIRIVLLRS